MGIAEALLAGSAPRLPDLQFLPTLSAGSVQSLEIKNGNFYGAGPQRMVFVVAFFLQ